jgi:hypothetical protein
VQNLELHLYELAPETLEFVIYTFKISPFSQLFSTVSMFKIPKPGHEVVHLHGVAGRALFSDNEGTK